MLRAKQISSLSQAARTFYLSGPRCGSVEPVDGASCSCSEDENCSSQKQSTNTLKQTKTQAAAYAVVKVGSPLIQNGVRPTSHKNSTYPASVRTALSSSSWSSGQSPVSKSNSFLHDRDKLSGNDVIYSPKIPAEQVVTAGMATVGMFSKLKSNKSQKEDPESRNCTVYSATPTKGDNFCNDKPKNRANHSNRPQNQQSSTSFDNSSTSSSQNSGERTSKSAYIQTKQSDPGKSPMIEPATDSRKQRECIPQRAKPEERTSGGRVGGSSLRNDRPANKFHNSVRSARSHGKGSASRSVISGRIIEQYSNTLRHLEWGPRAEIALDNIPCKLDPFQANQILKLLHDYSVAIGFFKWLKSQPGFKHDDHTYTTMIGILGQARQFDAMRRLLEEMIRDGCQPNVVTYNRLIHAYGRANFLEEAAKVFHEMQEAGHKPDRVTYCTLIDIHAKAGYLEVALDLYQQMQEVGLSPDTFTYSAMVNCLGKGGHLAEAYKLFCDMVAHGCVPNLVTYNIMITLQAKARNYPVVVKLYRDMQAAGFRPDKITYSIVMDVLGQFGHVDEAESVFEEMAQHWVPDEPVYGLLVDMWGKAGNLDKARVWYQAMLDAGLRPNVPACNSLLSAYLRVHRFADAYDMLAGMIRLGLVPSLQTYTLLLSCCTEMQIDMGLCCKLMAITEHPAHTFLLSLPDAEPSGENVRVHANRFFDLVHSEDRESKRGLVDAIIDFLHKSDLKEEAGLVWEVAAERNVYPDSVRRKRAAYWLINLHVMSDGTAITALSRTLAWFQRQKLRSGIGPSRIDIITGWGRRSRVTGSSLVRQAVEDMLNLFKFPFFTEKGNSGCFIGCGESLDRWLLNSFVERMHLL